MTSTIVDRAPDLVLPAGVRPARVRTRGTKPLVLLGLLIVAGGGAAWYGHDWWTVGRFIVSTDDAFVGGDVTVIAPKIAGFIAEVAVTDNQEVHAGDLLVRLDDRDYRAALARADAAVSAQRAALANLDATRALQDSRIAEARADIGGATADLTYTRTDQARYRQLALAQVGSLQNSQRADAEAQKAVSADLKARAALQSSSRQLAVIDTQKQQAEASLAQALADRDLARLALGYTELRAPADGVIGNRAARTGAYATVGVQLVALVPARGLWVDANFKESQLAGMHPGQPVRITAEAAPDTPFTGRVVSIAPATGAQFSILPAENATGNFTKIVQRVPVRIALDGAGSTLGALRPGLSVTAIVDERKAAP